MAWSAGYQPVPWIWWLRRSDIKDTGVYNKARLIRQFLEVIFMRTSTSCHVGRWELSWMKVFKESKRKFETKIVLVQGAVRWSIKGVRWDDWASTLGTRLPGIREDAELNGKNTKIRSEWNFRLALRFRELNAKIRIRKIMQKWTEKYEYEK